MKTTALALVSVLFASSAFAADAIDTIEPPIPTVASTPDASGLDTFSWNGVYLGFNGGYAGGKFKNSLTASDLDTNESFTDTTSASHNGFVGGVQAGYNWQFDNVVAGIEADFQGSSLKKDTFLMENDGTSLSLKNRLDWFGTARGRVGYTVSPTAMVYATGGAAYGKVKTAFELSDGVDTESVSWSKNKVGYTVGGGTEIGLTNEISFKTEYLYSDLGKAKMFDYSDADLGESLRGENKLQFHTIRAGINYKF